MDMSNRREDASTLGYTVSRIDKEIRVKLEELRRLRALPVGSMRKHVIRSVIKGDK